MRKYIYFSLLTAFSFTFSACHLFRKATPVETVKPLAVTPVVEEKPLPPPPPPPPVPTSIVGDVNIIAIIERGTCFGKCPAFEAKFYANGIITYTGHQYVERLGQYQTQVPPNIIDDIRTHAAAADYWKLANEYPENKKQIILDFPITRTYVRAADHSEKLIRNRNNAPTQLVDFELYLEHLLLGRQWIKTGD